MTNGLFEIRRLFKPAASSDAELGRMFAWAGGICELLWMWGLLVSRTQFRPIDLTPFPLYAALAMAGLFLLLPSSRMMRTDVQKALADPELARQATTRIQSSGSSRSCKVLAAGPMPAFYPQLRKRLEEEGIAAFEEIESPYYAHDSLRKRALAEIPDFVIRPALMPVISSVDFLRLLRLESRLNSIPVVVWGDGLRAADIRQLYDCGAASVIPGSLTEEHLQAFRQFCIAVRGF